MKMLSQEHLNQVRGELRAAGVSRLGMLSFTAHYLPRVIHEDEHIEAVVFGRHREAEGLLASSEGILVATNKRIVYLDHKPGFTTLDEIAYEVVSGVRTSEAGLRSSLTLFTKIANYTISFAKTSSVERFAEYIETRRIDSPPVAEEFNAQSPSPITGAETIDFLKTHEVAVLSTIDRTGNITGAAVYYLLEGDFIYIITKMNTKKSRNIMNNQQIALTIYDAARLQIVQIKGFAEIEMDSNLNDYVYQLLTKPRRSVNGEHRAPVTKIGDGGFIVFRISPVDYTFSDFS